MFSEIMMGTIPQQLSDIESCQIVAEDSTSTCEESNELLEGELIIGSKKYPIKLKMQEKASSLISFKEKMGTRGSEYKTFSDSIFTFSSTSFPSYRYTHSNFQLTAKDSPSPLLQQKSIQETVSLKVQVTETKISNFEKKEIQTEIKDTQTITLPQSNKEKKETTKSTPAPLHKNSTQLSSSKTVLSHKSEPSKTQDSRSSTIQLNGQCQKWTQEETETWWENRYHRRIKEDQEKEEGQGQHHRNPQQEQQFSDSEEEDEISIRGAVQQDINTAAKSSIGLKETPSLERPILEPPKLGVFSLYFMLTKIGLLSDSISNHNYKQEIRSLDEQTTRTHQERIQQMRESLKKEKSVKRWGVGIKVFSFMTSCTAVIAGAALIATGAGAVAGSMLLAGGIIQLTNQILDITGGWSSIADLLPGDSPEHKHTVITWMQIGILVLCVILSGAGIIWGGFSAFSEVSSLAQTLTGAVGSVGYGICSIGRGVEEYKFKNALSEIKRHNWRIAQLKQRREDLMDKVEWGVERLEQLFKELTRALEFETTLFRADQMAIA